MNLFWMIIACVLFITLNITLEPSKDFLYLGTLLIFLIYWITEVIERSNKNDK